MKNRLGYVGLLGLLGITGFFADNYAYFALFAFLYFIRYFWVLPDELFCENVRRAATPSFFTSLTLYALTVALTAFHPGTLLFVIGLVASAAVPFVLFALLLTIFEWRETHGKPA